MISLRYLMASAFLAGSLVGSAQTAPEAFGGDSRLVTKISMRAKIVSLADFAAQMKKLTGIPMSVASDIADRKITAIYRDRPAAEVLGAVQDALFLEWKKVGDGYKLTLPTVVDHEEQELIQAERDAVRSGVLKSLTRYAQIAAMSPDEIASRIKDLKDRAMAREASRPPNSKSPELQEMQALRSVSGQAICGALSGALPAVTDSILAGKTVCASTRAEDPVPKIPASYLDHASKMRSGPPTAALVLMRYVASEEMVEGESCFVGSSPRMGSTITDFFVIRPSMDSPDIQKSKFLARLAKWQSQADKKVLDKTFLSSVPATLMPRYFDLGGMAGLTLADHLEYIADHADVPVIGDAFRVYCSGKQFRGEATIRSYIQGLMSSNHMEGSLSEPPVGFVSSTNGWLFVRHRSFWRRQLTEAPEAVLKPIEDAAQTKGVPTSVDYGRFAAALDYDQAMAITNNGINMAFRFNPFPLQHAYSSLRLWATLSDAQMAAAQNGGFKLSELSPAQAKLLIDGWAEKMWRGQVPVTLWASFLSPRGLIDTNPTLNYRSDEFKMEIPPASELPPGADPPASLQVHVQFTYVVRPGVMFADDYVVSGGK
ncbi:MAG: hypothetical protein P4L46_09480 [Fimbriimonas sp.]|nr:hypothetical protein [Fimbriimonas sp.]